MRSIRSVPYSRDCAALPVPEHLIALVLSEARDKSASHGSYRLASVPQSPAQVTALENELDAAHAALDASNGAQSGSTSTLSSRAVQAKAAASAAEARATETASALQAAEASQAKLAEDNEMLQERVSAMQAQVGLTSLHVPRAAGPRLPGHRRCFRSRNHRVLPRICCSRAAQLSRGHKLRRGGPVARLVPDQPPVTRLPRPPHNAALLGSCRLWAAIGSG